MRTVAALIIMGDLAIVVAWIGRDELGHKAWQNYFVIFALIALAVAAGTALNLAGF